MTRPFSTTTKLYSWQQAAVDKLVRPRVSALFMDMGTGKTRTAIELVARRQRRISNVVWFCPVSLKETIEYEIGKHTDGASVHVFDANGLTDMRNVPRAFWYVVGIESMSSSDRTVLTANALINPASYVLVDESGYIKGHHALRTQRITALSARARYRTILTGTPMSQGVQDLFSQMGFLSPKILGYNSFYSFAANHLEYSEKYPGLVVRAHNTEWLAAKMQPYVYQVTKDECLDLPDKLFDRRYFGMTDEQREAYQRAKYEILFNLDDDEIDSYVIFRLFTALQQITSGFWNYRPHVGAEPHLLEFEHRRTDALLDAVADLPAGAQVVIWCKFVYSLRQIAETLGAARGADGVALFYGGLDARERSVELARWRHGDVRFLVATQATGGHGLDMTNAHYVMFYENSFKYAQRLQAEDRCHRIGQTERVTYLDLVCRRSIDERIQKALHEKGDALKDFRREIDKVKDKKAAAERL